MAEQGVDARDARTPALEQVDLEQELADTRLALMRRDAQVTDLSRQLAESLAALAVARKEREVPEWELSEVRTSRAWSLLVVLYRSWMKLRSILLAPARALRAVKGRLRRAGGD